MELYLSIKQTKKKSDTLQYEYGILSALQPNNTCLSEVSYKKI